MTAEVRTTVDEKIISNMQNVNAEPATPAPEPIVDEVKNEEPIIKAETESDVAETLAKIPDVADTSKDQEVSDKDDYGNPVASKKTYTEDEVNELMRQRFNRTRKEEAVRDAPQQKQVQQTQEEDNWEETLKGFVKQTFKEMSHEEQQRVRQAREQESMDRLQSNILQSMNKYNDFKDVVGKVANHMSDNMVKATKNFKDPGAFIYAASKTQAKELERISQLDDPLDQAAEIGKLEEKMRKIRMSASSSPKPVSHIQGDIENRSNVRGNIDDLIRKDALKKLNNRRF